jgi:hypothetical protein
MKVNLIDTNAVRLGLSVGQVEEGLGSIVIYIGGEGRNDGKYRGESPQGSIPVGVGVGMGVGMGVRVAMAVGVIMPVLILVKVTATIHVVAQTCINSSIYTLNFHITCIYHSVALQNALILQIPFGRN